MSLKPPSEPSIAERILAAWPKTQAFWEGRAIRLLLGAEPRDKKPPDGRR